MAQYCRNAKPAGARLSRQFGIRRLRICIQDLGVHNFLALSLEIQKHMFGNIYL